MTGLVCMLVAFAERPAPAPVSLDRVDEARARVAAMDITLDTTYALRHLDEPGYWAQAVPGQFVIKYATGTDVAGLVAGFSGYGAREISRSKTGADFVVVEIDDRSTDAGKSFIRDVYDRPGVLWAEPRLVVHTMYTPNDPYYSDQWGPYVMYMDLAWDVSLGEHSVSVGVVDEGCDYLHPDLAANFGSDKGYDFVDDDSDPYPDDLVEEFHGTHVSGTVAGVIGNGVGVTGMANITLLSVRVLDETGSGYLDDVADGIRWAADQGVRVISMSLGAGSGATTLEEACNYAYDTMGVLVVAASGNDGMGSISYPAAYSACIAVGAFDTSGTLAYFSNYGYEQEVVAPGVWVVSTVPNSSYDYYDGTSMATPHVSGLSALLFSIKSDLTNEDVRSILQGTAIDMGGSGWDMTYGYGLVDGQAAAQVVSAGGAASDMDTRIFITQNPARGTAHFLVSFPDLGSYLRIYDGSGRLVDRVPIAETRVSWTAPKPGVYFASTGGKNLTFIVK